MRSNPQSGFAFVRDFITVFKIQNNFYTVTPLMFIGNIDCKTVFVFPLRFDLKEIMSRLSSIQQKSNPPSLQLIQCLDASRLITCDGGNFNAVGIRADDRHFIFQKSIGQFVIIHRIRRFGLLILAENLSPTAIIERITHLQCDIISDVQNDFKVSRMPVCKGGNRNPIGIGGFPLRHFHNPPTLSVPAIQLAPPGDRIGGIAGAHNSRARAFGISADQFHLVANHTGQLVVLDFIRNTAIGQAKQRAFVIAGSSPCKGKLHIRELLICDLIPEKHIPFRSPDRK